MWLIYALIGGIANALGGLVAKKSVEHVKDFWMRSFYFSFFLTLIMLPFFIYEFSLPTTLLEVTLILFICAIVVINNYLTFKSYDYLGPATVNVVGKLRFIWVTIIGITILNQYVSLKNVIGMILVLAASLIIIDYKNWKSNKKGLYPAIIATVSMAVYATLLSVLAQTISPFSLLFYVSIIPAIINAFLIPNIKTKIKSTIKNTKLLLVGAVLGVVCNFCMIMGVKEELTKYFFVMETGIIIILIGEYFWLKDKKYVWLKLLSIILAIMGAILLR